MAKLTSPRVSVTFTELGISAITRGDKGTVALIVRDSAELAPFALTQASQTPEALGKENQDYIKRTFLGYVSPPKKVIVYVRARTASCPRPWTTWRPRCSTTSAAPRTARRRRRRTSPAG